MKEAAGPHPPPRLGLTLALVIAPAVVVALVARVVDIGWLWVLASLMLLLLGFLGYASVAIYSKGDDWPSWLRHRPLAKIAALAAAGAGMQLLVTGSNSRASRLAAIVIWVLALTISGEIVRSRFSSVERLASAWATISKAFEDSRMVIGTSLLLPLLVIAVPPEGVSGWFFLSSATAYLAVQFAQSLRALGSPPTWQTVVNRLHPFGRWVPLAFPALAFLQALGVFTFVTYTLVAVGSLHFSGSNSPTPGLIAVFYIWHLAAAIPVAQVPETLLWKQPLQYTNPGIGGLVLTFQVVAILPVIAAIRHYWQHHRELSTNARQTPGE